MSQIQSPTARAIDRGLALLLKAELAVVAFCFVAITLALLADIAGRELFGNGIYWASKTASYLATIAGIVGFSIVVAHGRHLRISSADVFIPERYEVLVNRIADAISAAVCLFLAILSIYYVKGSIEIGTRGVGIDIPVWPIQMVLPYAFLSGAVRYGSFAVFPSLRPSGEQSAESEPNETDKEAV